MKVFIGVEVRLHLFLISVVLWRRVVRSTQRSHTSGGKNPCNPQSSRLRGFAEADWKFLVYGNNGRWPEVKDMCGGGCSRFYKGAWERGEGLNNLLPGE